MDIESELKRTIQSLDEHIKAIRALGFEDSARLLQIVRLDLQMKLHGISHEELRALSEAAGNAEGQDKIARLLETELEPLPTEYWGAIVSN
jgi:hypothetical protein